MYSKSQQRVLFGNVNNLMTAHEMGGSAVDLYDAMADQFEMVGSMDGGVYGWRQHWSAEADPNHSGRTQYRSQSESQQLFSLENIINSERHRVADQSFDIYFQYRSLFAPYWITNRPYALYCDTTLELTQKHWPAWAKMNAEETKAWKMTEAMIYERAKWIFTGSMSVNDSLMNQYNQASSRIHHVGQGIPRLSDAVHGAYDQCVILAVIDDFARQDGQTLLNAYSEARKEIPSARLWVIGGGDRPKDCPPGVMYFNRDGKNLDFSRLMTRASFFVQVSQYEPYAGACMEAMMHGLCPIISPMHACSEMVDDGLDGLIVQPCDLKHLTMTLKFMLRSPNRAARMGQEARKRIIRDHLWSDVVSRIDEVIQHNTMGNTAQREHEN